MCVQVVACTFKNVSMKEEVGLVDVHRRLSSSPLPVYQQVITTMAGNSFPGFSGDGGPAINAQLSNPTGVAVDNLGNVFVADTTNNRVRMITKTTGVIMTIAGGGQCCNGGDGGPATLAWFSQPQGVAVDSMGGNLYISDSGYHVIRLVVLITGVITTYAGTFQNAGYSGDGGSATISKLYGPTGIALDGNGNLYICDYYNNVVRLVNRKTGVITSVAGGTATITQLSNPTSVTADPLGNFYIVDRGNSVRLVTSTGIITTFAGGGSCCTVGNNGPATSAYLSQPQGVALDAMGNVYFSTSNGAILLVTKSTGIITTYVGGMPSYPNNGDNGPATSSYLSNPKGLAIDAGGSLYVVESNKIRQVSYLPLCGAGMYVSGANCVACPVGTYNGYSTSLGISACLMCATGTWSASLGSQSCNPCDAGTFVSTTGATTCTACPSGYNSQSGVSACSACTSGTYAPSSGSASCTACSSGSYSNTAASICNSCLAGTFVSTAGSTVCTSCPAGSYTNGPGKLICELCPGGFYSSTGSSGCSLCASGQYSTPGSSTCVACPSGQTSTPGFSFCVTVTAPLVSAYSSVPSMAPTYAYALTTTGDVNTYVIPPRSFLTTISTITGSNSPSYSGDDSAATSAYLNYPYGVALDISGNLYIADTNNHRIRLVMKNTGIIRTYAGSSSGSYSGDGSAATSAYLYYPHDVALDSTGALLYIADHNNYRIRLVTKGTSSNIITTFAGNGQSCCILGDGGAATSATLNYPSGVAVDSLGLVYIAVTSNNRIRVVSKTGIITTIAGKSSSSYSGDNGLATSAYLWSPYGVAIDSTGTFLYIADTQNNRIRLVTINHLNSSNNIITTYVGNGNMGSSGDGSAATSAQLNSPRRVALDSSNNLYIADTMNNKVRLVM